jgi:hypothetical protein
VATTLRELLLAIKIKVDKAAVKETDAAFVSATKSAQGFEDTTNKITAGLQKVSQKLRVNTELAKRFRAAVIGASGLRPEAPSNRAARERRAAEADTLGLRSASHPAPPRPGQPSMAAPDVSKFEDNRSGPRKALDGFKAAASSAMASAGAAAERFNARFDQLTGSIFNARMAMAGFAAVVAGSAIGRFVNDVIQSGAELHTMAKRTRVSVETLQVWRGVAAGVNADSGAVTSAFQRLSRSMNAAGKGGKAQAASFKELGVQLKDGDRFRPTEDVLIDVGVALAQMDDDAKASAMAMQLLGPAGAALVPAFTGGAEAIRKQTAALRENVSLNAEEAARLEEVGSALERGGKKWKALKDRAIVAILPLLEKVAGAFEAVSKWVLRMGKETKALQTIFGALVAGGLFRLVTMFGAWIVKVGGARAALALLGNGLRTAAGFAFRFLMPLLLIEDFLTFLAGGKSVFGRAFEEILGPGGANKIREGILAALTEIGRVLNETLLPAVGSLVNNDLFKGVAKGALDGILAVLNLIGFALADTDEKAAKLAETFRKNAASLGLAPSKEEVNASVAKGLPENRKELSGPEKFLRKAMVAIVGDPNDKPAIKANNEQNAKLLHERQLAMEGVVASPAAPPQPGAAGKNVTLNDQRKIEINVGSGTPSPGATGRAVGSEVQGALQVDQRQVLQSVGG